jgi:photosystem II stability/assembly factor-like uncharacterized protein
MNKRWFALAAVCLAWIAAAMILAWSTDLIGSENVSGLAWAAAPEAEPTIIEVDPSSAPNDLDTPFVITGTGFTAVPTLALGGMPIDDVGWVSSATLTATLPWGMDPGVYTLTVANPGGESGSLPGAFTVSQGFGVWNAGELYGGEVQQIVVNPVTPTTLYASTHGGLFRSRNGGESWSFKLTPSADYPAIDPLSPNRIYVHSYPHQPSQFLFRSDDEGDTWIPLTTTFPTTYTSGYDCWGGFGIHPHPTAPGVVYVNACDNGEGRSGLILSTNWGQDWAPATNGLTDTQVTAFAFHPDDPGIMVVGTAGGNIFHSSDGGASWTHASRPLEYVATLAVNPFGDHEVWVSSLDAYGAPCALRKSANAELTAWTTMEPVPGEPLCAVDIEFAPTVSATVYVAVTYGRGYKTTNGGAAWLPFGGDVGQRGEIHDIALHPIESDTVYLGGFVHGVHKTTDGGGTWQVANQGLTAMFPEQLVTVPGQPELVYARFRFQPDVFKSTRGGATWRRLPITTPQSIQVDPSDPKRVYVGLVGRVYLSTDGGDTWPEYGELSPPSQHAGCSQWPRVLLTVPGQPGVLLAGVEHSCSLPTARPGSIYRSTDYGSHWDHVYPTATHEISFVQDLAYDPLSPIVVYAATGAAGHGGGLFRSTDGGANWEPVGAGVIDSAQRVVVEPGTHRVFVSKGCLPLYVSSDGGATWAPTGLGGGHSVEDILFAPGVSPGDPPVLYDAASQGLYRSTDGAQSWQQAAGELGQIPIYALAAVTTTDRVILYAGTTGGHVESGEGSVGFGNSPDAPATYLVNAGVYRYTSLRRWWVYLPLVVGQQ